MITIAVGPAAKLQYDTAYTVSSVPIQAGEFWMIPPRLNLLDNGGNLVVGDSSSMVNVTLDGAPKGAKLGPASSLFSIALGGAVTFSRLVVNQAGNNFRLSFVLSTFSQGTSRFTVTKITTYSEYFMVLIGPPRVLTVVTPPSDATAGGQAFGVQPQVQMTDYGGNLLTNDYTSTATASMVSSLTSTGEIILVDTRTAKNANKVLGITANVPSGTYGAGTHLVLTVNFLYEVFLSKNHSIPQPYLAINIVTASGYKAHAIMQGSYQKTKQLHFNYTIAPGDRIPRSGAYRIYYSYLNYLNTSSLNLNNSVMVDGNKNPVVAVMPNPMLNGLYPLLRIKVDTTPPYVVANGVSTTTPNGEYGVGQVIYFNVTYNSPVEVYGLPYLVLNPNCTNATSPFFPYAAAIFLAVSQNQLLFRYQVNPNDILLNGTYLGLHGRTIHLPQGAYIRRLSNVKGSGTVANVSIAHTVTPFFANHRITIDHEAPIIDIAYGVQTNKPNGIYYPGENIFIRIRFNKPVVTSGISVNIYLQTGPNYDPLNGIALLSNNNYDGNYHVLEFLYTVAPNSNRTGANYVDIINNDAALFVGGGTDTWIRRRATIPTLDVNPSTHALYNSGKSLRNTAQLQVLGFTPYVVSVHLHQVHRLGHTGFDLYPDDYVIVRLVWSERVMATCSPILMMDTGRYEFTLSTYLINSPHQFILSTRSHPRPIPPTLWMDAHGTGIFVKLPTTQAIRHSTWTSSTSSRRATPRAPSTTRRKVYICATDPVPSVSPRDVPKCLLAPFTPTRRYPITGPSCPCPSSPARQPAVH